MKCAYDMCPYQSLFWKKCSIGLNPEKPCYYPESYKNYKETIWEKFLNFLDDLLITPTAIRYIVLRFFKRG